MYVLCRHTSCDQGSELYEAGATPYQKTDFMLATIGDVKAVANKLYPAATKVTVQRVDPGTSTSAGYRLFAVDGKNRMLGRVSAPTLNELKDRLEQRLNSNGHGTPA